MDIREGGEKEGERERDERVEGSKRKKPKKGGRILRERTPGMVKTHERKKEGEVGG